jgi:peptidoglycan L-alanyl-D-glutamate endopeptidase CwlK
MTCDEQLIGVANEVIKYIDFSVIEGHRTVERQHELFLQGKTTIDGITKKGQHNFDPSRAFDLLPFPGVLHGINVWADTNRFLLFVGFVKGVARANGVILRAGADWDGDGSTINQSFHDLPHFEISLWA